MQRLRELVEGPVVKQLMASLQARTQSLASTVKAARAGLQNRLRTFFVGKSSHASHGSPGGATGGVNGHGVKYPSSSIEAQTRMLADYTFLLGDYQTALGYYRNAAGEFKGDRAWWHYAAALEMQAICLHMTDGPWKEMDECAEKAASTYLKLASQPGDKPSRHATRAVLLEMDLLTHAPPKKREQATREVAQALVDQSTQEASLCAALLLEQAAICFRSARVPLERKYAFYLILAGYRYISCSQRRHAVRTYAAALRVYGGRGWSHIEDHVHFTLGRNCSQLGRIELSLAYFLRLLRHSRQPAERQQTFMREQGSILKAHPEKALLPALPLPRFACKTIRILLNDHNQPAHSQAAGLLSAVHPLWKPLTAPLLPQVEAATGNWLTGGVTSASKADAPSPCVLGEWVFVELEVENPMHVQLVLSSLKLQCTHQRPDGSKGGGAAATTPDAAAAAAAAEEASTPLDPLAENSGGDGGGGGGGAGLAGAARGGGGPVPGARRARAGAAGGAALAGAAGRARQVRGEAEHRRRAMDAQRGGQGHAAADAPRQAPQQDEGPPHGQGLCVRPVPDDAGRARDAAPPGAHRRHATGDDARGGHPDVAGAQQRRADAAARREAPPLAARLLRPRRHPRPRVRRLRRRRRAPDTLAPGDGGGGGGGVVCAGARGCPPSTRRRRSRRARRRRRPARTFRSPTGRPTTRSCRCRCRMASCSRARASSCRCGCAPPRSARTPCTLSLRTTRRRRRRSSSGASARSRRSCASTRPWRCSTRRGRSPPPARRPQSTR